MNEILFYVPQSVILHKGALQATASWIQQLSDQGSSLMPWIPGDSGHAKLMLDAAISCIQPLLQALLTTWLLCL